MAVSSSESAPWLVVFPVEGKNCQRPKFRILLGIREKTTKIRDKLTVIIRISYYIQDTMGIADVAPKGPCLSAGPD